jgi:signal transduction histidine kinase
MLALMDQQVASCDRTIAALLDFARPDQAHPEPMDLNSLVQTVLAEAPRPGSIGLQMDLEPDLPAALADSHQVSEVLGNLITNALQAMGDEGELRVRTWHDAGARQVLVEVSDTGPGIPEENLRRIFDPLFTTKAKGIGLGLVVCKRLVERQSGTLTVRSAEGEGAAFTVALPCVDR